ncbi:oxidoreductase [Vitiosangium sp. GDMCC 1.1324]|uniref:oxidoreductase n=1 Tax=Vitiosangium sp. (strain GDMCC 1.1324) TaxID=2138576 RepID=UPI000D36E3B0|nr:oxidoreductase [Vitiosangium sp. GDMCC 1.1324]PTL74906.1 oxidoreductase [Vitiosangium sp. GDMCC 1.1324]
MVTIPLKNDKSVPVEPLERTSVIGTNNDNLSRDGQNTELAPAKTTISELPAHLPWSKERKVNHIWFEHLKVRGEPAGSKNRRALAIARVGAEAKKTVAGSINASGFDVVDADPLSEEWRIQRRRHAELETQG